MNDDCFPGLGNRFSVSLVPDYHRNLARKARPKLQQIIDESPQFKTGGKVVLEKLLAIALHISSLNSQANTLHGILSLSLGEILDSLLHARHGTSAGIMRWHNDPFWMG